jgi:ABC-type uncharacterized transport system involved in gliding motility auxiliary subunit
MARFASFPWRSLRPLLWAGPILLVAGLASGFVSGSWGTIPSAIVIAGGCITLLGLLLSAPGGAFWGKRSTQSGSNALFATLAVLLILGLINFIAVRYNQRVDLTENQVLSLAPQSQQIVKTLKQPAKIWVFKPTLGGGDQNFLDNLQRANPDKLQYELVDPQIKIALARKFKVNAYGDVYLESNQRQQFIQALGQGESLSESKVVNALAKLGSGEPTPIYFLEGHGEHPLEPAQESLAQAVQGMEGKNLIAQSLNLSQTPIPANAKVVAIAGAQRPLLSAEVEKLQAFVKQGGGLFLLIDPNVTLGLEPFLKEWGVTLENALVVDPTGQAANMGPAVTLVNQYGQSPITQDFKNGYSLYPLSRPLQTQPVAGIQITPLLLTSQQSWAEMNLKDPQLTFNPDAGDRQGPLTIGVALSRSLTSPAGATPSPGTAKPEARMVVIGNSRFATGDLFRQQLNGDMFLNSVSWLSQNQDVVLSIQPKEPKNRRITLSASQGRLLVMAALIMTPVLAFGSAFGLWWSRR